MMSEYYLNEFTLGKAMYIIIPAIVNIDSGCGHCICKFIKEANEIFDMAGLSAKFEYDEENDEEPIKFVIFDDLLAPKYIEPEQLERESNGSP
jgi:hypothetical protein